MPHSTPADLLVIVWASYSVRVSQWWEVTDSVEYLVACCDRQPLIWRRCGGASHGVFYPGTSPRWTLCRWAGSCKGSPPHKTALNMSGKKHREQRDSHLPYPHSAAHGAFYYNKQMINPVRIKSHHFVLVLFDNLLILNIRMVNYLFSVKQPISSVF